MSTTLMLLVVFLLLLCPLVACLGFATTLRYLKWVWFPLVMIASLCSITALFIVDYRVYSLIVAVVLIALLLGPVIPVLIVWDFLKWKEGVEKAGFKYQGAEAESLKRQLAARTVESAAPPPPPTQEDKARDLTAAYERSVQGIERSALPADEKEAARNQLTADYLGRMKQPGGESDTRQDIAFGSAAVVMIGVLIALSFPMGWGAVWMIPLLLVVWAILGAVLSIDGVLEVVGGILFVAVVVGCTICGVLQCLVNAGYMKPLM